MLLVYLINCCNLEFINTSQSIPVIQCCLQLFRITRTQTILTDHHMSFLHTLSSLVRTREVFSGRSPISKLFRVKHA